MVLRLGISTPFSVLGNPCALLVAQSCLTPWTAALQASLSMGFSRQVYWSGLPCPPPEDLPNPGIKPYCRWILYCLSHRGSPGFMLKPPRGRQTSSRPTRSELTGMQPGLEWEQLHRVLALICRLDFQKTNSLLSWQNRTCVSV